MFNFEMIGVPMKDKGMDFYLTGFGKTNMATTMNEYAGEKLVGYLPIETKYMLFRASDNYPFLLNLMCLLKRYPLLILKTLNSITNQMMSLN